MNKIIKITGFMLIAVNALAFGMEEYRSMVYMTNRLRRTGNESVSIVAKIAYKIGNPKTITIDTNKTELLGNINVINKIEVVANTPTTFTGSIPVVGKYTPHELLATQAMKVNALRVWQDITGDFLAHVYPPQNNHNVMLITVDWKYPDSYFSEELKYTFKTGDFNPFIAGYPWKWVLNNTGSEIQLKEVIDPNSLYAQEMAEHGIQVGNPVKITAGKGWEIFEENKRFEVYSTISGWFEPDYADLEKQVAAGRLKKENTYKSPAISISSKKCFGVSTGCGWDFQIVWIDR